MTNINSSTFEQSKGNFVNGNDVGALTLQFWYSWFLACSVLSYLLHRICCYDIVTPVFGQEEEESMLLFSLHCCNTKLCSNVKVSSAVLLERRMQ